jgi:hypothetical protein
MGRRPTGKVVVEGRFPSLEVRLEHCDDRSLIPVNSIAFGREGQGPSDCSTKYVDGYLERWRIDDPSQTEYCRLVPDTYNLTTWGLGIGMATFTLFEDGGYRVDNRFCGDDADYEVSAEPRPEAEAEGIEDQNDENPSSESEAVEGNPNASETEWLPIEWKYCFSSAPTRGDFRIAIRKKSPWGSYRRSAYDLGD